MNCIVFSGLVLSALLALSCSELCTPSQWEGFEGAMGGYVHHRRPGMIREFTRVSYDAQNKRVATFTNYVNEDYENKFHMVIRYDAKGNSGKAYIVDVKEDKCWVKTLDKPFKECCLPADAKKESTYYMGLKGKGGLQVTDYLVKTPKATASVAVSMLGDKIIPVSEFVYGGIWGTHFVEGVGFGDITAGIHNSSVFDIPKECKEDYDVSIAEFILRRQSILAI